MNLVWFRNDLRINDNPALWHACQQGTVLGLFVITPGQWKRHHMAACRVDFLLRNLQSLQQSLEQLAIPLKIVTVNDYADVAPATADICCRFAVKQVFFNMEYPVDEIQRDRWVEGTLAEQGIAVHGYHDRVIAPPGAVTRDNGEPYKVFTPFKNTWLKLLDSGLPECFPAPGRQQAVGIESDTIPGRLAGFECSDSAALWPAGEQEAQRRLDTFVDHHLASYHQRRDIPASGGTSTLSPYLALGVISPQRCLLAAMAQPGEGSSTWINELIWRDFYQHLALSFPQVCKFKPFKRETDNIPWRRDEKDFSAWCEGKTGVPIVDAGMRQLRQTGWMHNRLRMVCAMFLTKNLLIDWRLGEQFFMGQLIDGEFAANNGGWQWSASTGTDAAPYFRIFNPFSQAQRFDPDGVFIREFVPELKDLSPRDLHVPARLAKAKPDSYPDCLVDVGLSRKIAIETFRTVLHGG